MDKFWQRFFIIIFSLTLLLSFLSAGAFFYTFSLRPMVKFNQPPIVINLERNTTALQFVNLLKSKDLIYSRSLLLYVLRIQGITNRLKAGVYQINPGETAAHFLRKVLAGDGLMQLFRIKEGSTINQLQAELKHTAFLSYNPNVWRLIAGSFGYCEGLFLADTYKYRAGGTAEEILKIANKNLWQYLNYCWSNRVPNLPYKSPYELLIAASIIEKEASIILEKKIIAGIIAKRLEKKMRLQMDPTVIYARDNNPAAKISHSDLSSDSPYNTYKHFGLPPTPIAIVSKETIYATAHPITTDYLYFVARGDGTHEFSTTYDEQRQAILRYQKRVSLTVLPSLLGNENRIQNLGSKYGETMVKAQKGNS